MLDGASRRVAEQLFRSAEVLEQVPQVLGVDAGGRAESVERLLECHVRSGTWPDGTAADLAALAHQEVPGRDLEQVALLRRNLHLEHASEVETSPLDVHVAQIGHRVC